MRKLLILLFLIPSITVSASLPIIGTLNFRQHVSNAIAFIRVNDLSDYKATVPNISLIEQNEKTWSFIIGYDGQCKVELSSSYATWQYDNLYQLGGDLVHEGSLCHDYWTGNTSDVRADELRALKLQRQFYLRTNAPSYLVEYMDRLIAENWPWGLK